MKEVKGNQKAGPESNSIHDLTTLSTEELRNFIREYWGNKVLRKFTDHAGQRLILAIAETKQTKRRRYTAASALSTFGM